MPDINDIVRQGGSLADYVANASNVPVPVDEAKAATIGLQKLKDLDQKMQKGSLEERNQHLTDAAQDEEFIHAAGYAYNNRRQDVEALIFGWEGLPKMSARAKRFRSQIKTAAVQARSKSSPQGTPLQNLETDTPPLVMHGPSIWMLDTDSTYFPVQKEVVATELNRIHGVTCFKEVDGVMKAMPFPEIYATCGQTAKELHWSCSTRQPTWNVQERVLTVPAGRLRDGPAVYNEVCATWLVRLCGDKLDLVLDWIVGLAHPDIPCPALTVVGGSGLGKSMLAAAIASLYGGFTAYSDVMRNFNDGLRKYPFVWLNEEPAESDPSIFRQITGDYEHRIEAKYHPVQILHGCLRVLATSNHEDPYRLGDGRLTMLDDEAIGARILYVQASGAARHYLVGIGGAQATAGWCDADGALTNHLRWILLNREVQRGSRFWIDVPPDEYMSRIGTQHGMPGAVLDAIATYLSMPSQQRGEIGDRGPCKFDSAYPDAVLVHAPRLCNLWPVLAGGNGSPPTEKVRGALQRLQRAPEKHFRLANGDRFRGYKILRSAFGERVDDETWPTSQAGTE